MRDALRLISGSRIVCWFASLAVVLFCMAACGTSSAQQQAQDSRVFTVCEILEIGRSLHGRNVRVRGIWSDQGSFPALRPAGCTPPKVPYEQPYAAAIWVTAPGRWGARFSVRTEKTYDLGPLREAQDLIKKEAASNATITVTVYGALESDSTVVVFPNRAQRMIGFGMLSAYPMMLIYDSVSDVVVTREPRKILSIN